LRLGFSFNWTGFMPDLTAPADVLLKAVQRVRELSNAPLVVKLGGSAMEEPIATRGTLESVVALRSLGVRLVLVHGGGKPIDRAMTAAGLTPRKVAGRRYTDDATLAIVVRVLGELNAGIVDQIRSLSGEAEGYHTLSSFPIYGRRLMLPGLDLQPIDLGRVGQVVKVDATHFNLHNRLPVFPSLAVDVDGGWLNVNADTVASAVAGAVTADAVLFLTDTPGVLANVSDASSVVPRLTRAECEAWIADGRIGGGMLPKVEACFEALDSGTRRAIILDGRKPHTLLDWFLGEPAGTEIVNNGL